MRVVVAMELHAEKVVAKLPDRVSFSSARSECRGFVLTGSANLVDEYRKGD